MTFDITQGIDLAQLERFDDDRYVYARRRGDTSLSVSRVPLKKRYFCCIPRGTSDQHRYGFEGLKAAVRRQFGFELKADNPATGLITFGSIKRQIAEARESNANVFKHILYRIKVEHTKKIDEDAGTELVGYAENFAKHHLGEGKNLSPEQLALLDRQLEVRSATLQFERRYGPARARRFQEWADKNKKGEDSNELTDAETKRWDATFKAEIASRELLGRIWKGLGKPAQEAACAVLIQRIAELDRKGCRLPAELLNSGHIPQAWADDAIDAALKCFLEQADTRAARLNRRKDGQGIRHEKIAARDLASSLKSQQARIDRIEDVIFGTADDARLKRVPVALFRPGSHLDGNIYETLDDLEAIDLKSAKQRKLSRPEDFTHLDERLTALQDLIRDGRALEEKEMPKEQAEYVMHIRATLRQIGVPNPKEFLSPKDEQALARRALELETKPGLDKRTIGQLLELDLAEKIADHGAGNLGSFSRATLELVKNPNELGELKRHDVTLESYGHLRRQGAANARVVAECVKLSVRPQLLVSWSDAENRRFLRWTQKGFSRAEAVAYSQAFDKPEDIADFRGSLLEPKVIKAYKESGIPYTKATCVRRFNALNQVGYAVYLRKGCVNKVYKTRYRDPEEPNGYVTRVFKCEPPAPYQPGVARLGAVAFRNCIASYIDRHLLGFNLLVPTEVGMVRSRSGKAVMGISMAYAKGKEAVHQSYGTLHEVYVTKGSQYDHLLGIKGLKDNQYLINDLCKRHQLSQIKFDGDKVSSVKLAYLARHKTDPHLQRQLTMLQWEIALFGVRDGHASNYKIHRDPVTRKFTVAAYDIDDGFNRKIRHPDKLQDSRTEVTLPPVADREIYDAFMRIDKEKYAKLLEPLSQREIDAALSRLDAIRDHLKMLESQGRVIPDHEWGSHGVTQLFSKDNSFVGRDCCVYVRQNDGKFVAQKEGV